MIDKYNDQDFNTFNYIKFITKNNLSFIWELLGLEQGVLIDIDEKALFKKSK